MLQAWKKALTGYHVNITLKSISKYPFHQITLSCTILHSLLYRNSDTYLDIVITIHTADAPECPWACKEKQTSMLLVPNGSFSSFYRNNSPIRDLNWTGAVNLKFTFKDSPETACRTKLVSGVHCIDVAIHLVSQWEPSLVGKIGLWATQTAAAVPFTAPGGSGTQPRFHLFTCYCWITTKENNTIISLHKKYNIKICNCHTS